MSLQSFSCNSCLNAFNDLPLRIINEGKKATSNKTPAFTKSMNMGIWVVGTSNRLFIRGP